MGAPLIRTRAVLTLEPDAGQPLFSDQDDDGRWTTIVLDDFVWRDMGEPETITVTVEPGDLLNVEEPVPAPFGSRAT
jgi:hypothetical protein